MTNYSVKNVDEFIAAASGEAQSHLREIRAAVKAALPEAEEKIGYGKPYYKRDRWLVGFDVYKHHIGFEIWEDQLPNQIRTTLEDKGYKTGNKTFQIRFDQKVPTTLIKKLAQTQATRSQAKVKSKTKK